MRARLRNGAEVVALELGAESHPLAEFVGMLKDDPLLESWKQAMAAYRRKVDEKGDAP